MHNNIDGRGRSLLSITIMKVEAEVLWYVGGDGKQGIKFAWP